MCVLSSKSCFQNVLELFNRFHKLAEILREKSGKGRTPSSKTPRSLLSLGFVSTLLTAVFRYVAVTTRFIEFCFELVKNVNKTIYNKCIMATTDNMAIKAYSL